MVSIARGDVTQMSFGFVVKSDDQIWKKDDTGRVMRTLTSVRLFDVSPVVFPAYAETAVAVRALDRWRSARQDSSFSVLRRRLDLLLVE
jgi:hypothetical protein